MVNNFSKDASPPRYSSRTQAVRSSRTTCVYGRPGGLILLSMSLCLALIASSPLTYAQPSIRPVSTVIAQQPTQSAVTAVESVGMTVSDMERAVDFYSQVLSFKKVSDVELLGSQYEQLQGLFGVRMRVVRMQLGSESIELSEYLTPKGKPFPIDTRSNDRWFQHTAIVVANTDASLKFYRDLLGMRLAGESENYGTEQEHLNNVFGARLHISGLRAPKGPGIEFLEYLTPKDGRPLPVDEHPNDLLHWQTTLVVKDTGSTAQQLRSNQSTFISPDLVAIPGQTLGFKKVFLVRDPDGHTMRLVEK
jgi:catechol 2,3-dioxygenase-like lactoylglutathione lyase family enzyme